MLNEQDITECLKLDSTEVKELAMGKTTDVCLDSTVD